MPVLGKCGALARAVPGSAVVVDIRLFGFLNQRTPKCVGDILQRFAVGLGSQSTDAAFDFPRERYGVLHMTPLMQHQLFDIASERDRQSLGRGRIRFEARKVYSHLDVGRSGRNSASSRRHPVLIPPGNVPMSIGMMPPAFSRGNRSIAIETRLDFGCISAGHVVIVYGFAHLGFGITNSVTNCQGNEQANKGRREPIAPYRQCSSIRMDPAQPASSRERRVAASTARLMSCAMPSAAISTSSAAAVVPPGEVTFWRKVAGSSGERLSSSPEPETVARASLVARSGGRPADVPARAKASTSRNT